MSIHDGDGRLGLARMKQATGDWENQLERSIGKFVEIGLTNFRRVGVEIQK
jgi:hypothetical protein